MRCSLACSLLASIYADSLTAEHAVVAGLDGDYAILDVQVSALSVLKIPTLHSQCFTLNGKSEQTWNFLFSLCELSDLQPSS